jgi:hypothetical protein
VTDIHWQEKRVGLIACEIFFREIAYFSARCEEIIDVVFLPKGLHDLGGEKMRPILQAEIDKMNEKDYKRIIMGYALCNNGLAGLTTSKAPLVIPRAHDCITLFMGSKTHYKDYFENHPGTYFHTSGWLERGGGEAQFFDEQLGPATDLESFIEKYGEENGRYLWEMLDPLKNYSKIAYINLPLKDLPDWRPQSKEMAKERGWGWEEIPGDPGLLERMICGPYSEDEFLILKPGWKTAPSNDGQVICAVELK